jgi:hypothetical protein
MDAGLDDLMPLPQGLLLGSLLIQSSCLDLPLRVVFCPVMPKVRQGVCGRDVSFKRSCAGRQLLGSFPQALPCLIAFPTSLQHLLT